MYSSQPPSAPVLVTHPEWRAIVTMSTPRLPAPFLWRTKYGTRGVPLEITLQTDPFSTGSGCLWKCLTLLTAFFILLTGKRFANGPMNSWLINPQCSASSPHLTPMEWKIEFHQIWLILSQFMLSLSNYDFIQCSKTIAVIIHLESSLDMSLCWPNPASPVLDARLFGGIKD